MNKISFVLLCVGLLSSVALAQVGAIDGAVSFKKQQVTTETKKENESKFKNTALDDTDFDQEKLMAEVTSNTKLWDNPRFVKIYYGQMKGMQQAIDRIHQNDLDQSSYSTEEEKEKAKKDLQEQALIHFEDYQDKPEDLHKKINKNPRESLLNMNSRISFIDEKNMTKERSKAVEEGLNQRFYETEGMTIDEYNEARKEQLEQEAKQRLKEDKKAQSFPILKTDKEVNIEKVDEQNALLKVSVGAPKSKKE